MSCEAEEEPEDPQELWIPLHFPALSQCHPLELSSKQGVQHYHPHHSAKPNLLTGFVALRPKGKNLKILLCSASFCVEQQVPTFQ